MNNAPVRGRFAPSPTGDLHLGNAWTALLAWLQVRQAKGTYVLRIEDLDPERSQERYTLGLLQDLRWLGLDWDEGPDRGGGYGPYRQSQRWELYEDALEQLRIKGLIYPCYCTRADIRAATLAPHGTGEKSPEYSGTCRSLSSAERGLQEARGLNASFRFRLQDETVWFEDLNYGIQSGNPWRELGDFVVRRSDNAHAYQLAVVVDDALMRITHVLRGGDLLPSVFRQIVLFRSLGWAVPHYTHVPLLYGPDGKRLSKRNGAVSLRALRERGVKPQKIVGLFACWAGLLSEPEEVIPEELIKLFDPTKLPRRAIGVDPDLLVHL